MKRTLCLLVAAAALVAAAPTPVAAEPAQHAFWPEAVDTYEHFGAGGNPCVTWPGTFHEARTGGYRVVIAPGGADASTLHVNGVIAGLIELIPDDTALPTYTGTYREKVDGVVTNWTGEGGTTAVAQYRLRTALAGTDGSRLELMLSGKLTTTAKGVVTVSRDVYTCA